jgi:hypothetical protein
MFDYRSVYMGFVAARLVLEQDFSPVLLLSPVRINLPFFIYLFQGTHPNAVRRMKT